MCREILPSLLLATLTFRFDIIPIWVFFTNIHIHRTVVEGGGTGTIGTTEASSENYIKYYRS